MNVETAKRRAEKAGLALYWDYQWRCWGLIGPQCRSNEGSIWYSSRTLRALTPKQYAADIEEMQRREGIKGE